MSDPCPNVFAPSWEERKVGGFIQRRMRIGRMAGSQRLGTSLYEIRPGEAPFPFHVHHANEEILIVLAGTPSVRTGDGWSELAEGDVLAFLRGEKGAHQVANFSDRPARVLIASEMRAPEVNRQPDSGKIGAFLDAPGTPDGRSHWFDSSSEVPYDERESPPPEAHRG